MPQRFISLIICSAIVLGLGACGAKSTAGLLTVRGRVAVDGSKSMQPFNLKAETVFGNFTGDEDTSVETSGDSVALKSTVPLSLVRSLPPRAVPAQRMGLIFSA